MVPFQRTLVVGRSAGCGPALPLHSFRVEGGPKKTNKKNGRVAFFRVRPVVRAREWRLLFRFFSLESGNLSFCEPAAARAPGITSSPRVGSLRSVAPQKKQQRSKARQDTHERRRRRLSPPRASSLHT